MHPCPANNRPPVKAFLNKTAHYLPRWSLRQKKSLWLVPMPLN